MWRAQIFPADRFRACRSAVAAVFAILALAERCATAGDGASNDDHLLKSLYAAQLTNSTLYPNGALNAKVTAHWNGEAFELYANVIWKGPFTYLSYKKDSSKAGRKLRDQAEMIETPELLVGYWPESKFVQKIADRVIRRSPHLLLRPDEIWFRLEGAKDWSALFANHQPSEEADRVPIAVTRQGDDLVAINRSHATGESLRITTSIAAGGNVVDYEGRPGQLSTIWRSGYYTWKIDNRGRPVLESYEYKRSVKGDPSDPDRAYRLEVSNFNPDAIISDDRFQLSSLKIPADATVEEVSLRGSKVFKYSQAASLDAAALNHLSESAREHGFAKVRE